MNSQILPSFTKLIRKIAITSLLLVSLCLVNLMQTGQANAQALTSGFFRGAGNADVTFSATYSGADEFYKGNNKIDLFPFYKTINRTTYSLFLGYGITDNLDITVNLPYIVSNGDGDASKPGIPPQHVDNIQDGQFLLKYRPWRTQAGPGRFNLAIVGAVGVPLSDYENGSAGDRQSKKPILVAIGDRTTRITGELLLQYRFYSGVFMSIQGGFVHNGKTNGGQFDVPNAELISGKLGYAGSRFYGALWTSNQFSNSGTDIGTTPSFPTNQVDYTLLGATFSYSFIPELSLNVSAFTTLDGQNALDRDAISGGITYKIR